MGTSQRVTAPSTPKQTVNMPNTQVFTPPSSTTFSFALHDLNPSSESKDIPLPSIEVPEGLQVKTQDGAIQGSNTSQTAYKADPSALGEANSDPPERELAAFRFGESKEPSPFTFRKMHNATPEPSRTDREIYSFGAAEPSADSVIKQKGRRPANSDLKGSQVPTAGYTGTSNPIPRSNIVRETTQYGRYDVKDERPPNEPYFDEQFQIALQRAKNVAGKIKSTLQECELAKDEESQVYGMIKTADELQSFDAPAVCTIGIVGDSGVGKVKLYTLPLLKS